LDLTDFLLLVDFYGDFFVVGFVYGDTYRCVRTLPDLLADDELLLEFAGFVDGGVGLDFYQPLVFKGGQ
jgi:hypothetical protein